MKTNIIRIILIILLLFTFINIFNFSNQNGEVSSGISRKVTNEVTKNIKKIQNLEKDEKEKVLDKIEGIIRKMAHFTEYTIVGILLILLMYTYNLKQKTRITTSIIIGAIYASSDEIHQIFIPGRTAAVTDVMIDTTGVCAGIILVVLLIYIINKIKKKVSQN